jgi:DNA-binding NarL/FixJ family response regulator
MSSQLLPTPGLILVADAVPLLRQGLMQVLAQANTGYCLHEAGTAADLLALTQTLAPALVLTSTDLPGAPSQPEGLLSALRALSPNLPVVVLTDPLKTPEISLLRLLRQNVSGLLARTAPIAEVCEMVSLVLQRGRFYNDYVLGLLQGQLNRRTRLSKPSASDFSTRQVEVLQLIAADHSNEEIAEYLATSVRTVEYHRSQMLQKTGARTTLGLVLFALRQGIFADKTLAAMAAAC